MTKSSSHIDKNRLFANFNIYFDSRSFSTSLLLILYYSQDEPGAKWLPSPHNTTGRGEYSPKYIIIHGKENRTDDDLIKKIISRQTMLNLYRNCRWCLSRSNRIMVSKPSFSSVIPLCCRTRWNSGSMRQ